MIDFNLEPYEWQKDMEVIMKNVDLSEICFLNNAAMLFTFHNTYDGGFYKKILCHNVWKFSKDINMEEGEGFRYFICDIRVAKLCDVEIEGAFSYFRYGLNIPQSNEYILLCMDSGDISICLICESVCVSGGECHGDRNTDNPGLSRGRFFRQHNRKPM